MINVKIVADFSGNIDDRNGKIRTQTPWVAELKLWLKGWTIELTDGVGSHPLKIEYSANADKKFSPAMASMVCAICAAVPRSNPVKSVLAGVEAGDVVPAIRQRQMIGGSISNPALYLDWLFPQVWVEHVRGDDAWTRVGVSVRKITGYVPMNLGPLLFQVWQEGDRFIRFKGFEDKRFRFSVEIQKDGKICTTDEELNSINSGLRKKPKESPQRSGDVSTLTEVIEPHSTPSSNGRPSIIGREWVYEEISEWIKKRGEQAHTDHGYFCIMGPPGIGKSGICEGYALNNSAFLLKFGSEDIGYHEFLRRIHEFLASKFPISMPPPGQTQAVGAGYLDGLFRETSSKPAGEKLVLVIDGLDEAPSGILSLLPARLPQGIYVLCSIRETDESDCPVVRHSKDTQTLLIMPDDERHKEDVRQYLDGLLQDEHIAEFAAALERAIPELLEIIMVRSEANFMYIYYMMYDMKFNRSFYSGIDDIPVGLEGYYKTHIERMTELTDDLDWEFVVLPLLAALQESQTELTIELLYFAGSAPLVGEIPPKKILEFLRKIGQFLVKGSLVVDEVREATFRIYHADFRQYLKFRAVLPDPKRIRNAVKLNLAEIQMSDYN